MGGSLERLNRTVNSSRSLNFVNLRVFAVSVLNLLGLDFSAEVSPDVWLRLALLLFCKIEVGAVFLRVQMNSELKYAVVLSRREIGFSDLRATLLFDLSALRSAEWFANVAGFVANLPDDLQVTRLQFCRWHRR